MKLLAWMIVTIAGALLLLLAAGGYAFTHVEAYKDQIAGLVSRQLGREVSVARLQSAWRDGTLRLMVDDLRVAGDTPDQPALAADAAVLEMDWRSLFRMWPTARNFTLRDPIVEVAFLPNGNLRIGGFEVALDPERGPPFQVFRWLMDHQAMDVSGGILRWKQLEGEVKEYRDIALIYRREARLRDFSGVIRYPEGNFLLEAKTDGNPFHDSDWDASLSLIAAGDDMEHSRSGLEVASGAGEGHLRIARLDLVNLRDILLLSGMQPALGKWMWESGAGGYLEDVDLSFSGPLDALEDWRLTAAVPAIHFAATERWPGIRNVGGDLRLGRDGGLVRIRVQDGGINWPQLFSRQLPVAVAEADLSWDYRGDAIDIRVSDGFATNEDIVISNFAASVAWESNDTPRGEFSLAFEVPDIGASYAYLPTRAHEKLRAWWRNAIIGGRGSEGQLSYAGEFSWPAVRNSEGALQGRVRFEDAILDYGYRRRWPVLNAGAGELLLDKDLIKIQPSYAELDNSTLLGGEVRIADIFERGRVLAIDAARIEGPLKDVLNLFLHGPLLKPNRQPNVGLHSGGGKFSSEFSLSMPLANIRNVQLIGTADIIEGQLILPTGDEITEIKGTVKFSERSVTAPGLTARFLGGPMRAEVKTTRKAVPPHVEIAGQGELQADELNRLIGPALASMLLGSTEYQARLQLAPGEFNILANSDLLGMAVEFPEPVRKPSDIPRSLSVKLDFSGGGERILNFRFGDKLSGMLAIGRDGGVTRFRAGELVYGNGEAILNGSPGLGLNVVADQLDADRWLDTLQHFSQFGNGGPGGFADAFRRVHIATNQTRLFSRDIGRMEITANSDDGVQWSSLITGEAATGWARLAPRAEPPYYEFGFDRLYWPRSEGEPPPLDDTAKPGRYPWLRVHANDFRYGERRFGALDLVARPEDEDWRVESLELVQPELTARASGIWAQNADGSTHSSFEFAASSEQGGEALEALGFSDFVEGGGLEVEGELDWRGPPRAFSLKTLSGRYRFAGSDGSILRVDPKGGRLFGLMNINALSRRLRLDFSDIFKGGLSFDHIGSEGKLVNGDILLDSFFILSPAVYMQAEGRVGLAAEDFDLEIVVSPQYGGGIAVLSALANPAAGAVVYLAQKLFREQLNEAVHDTYYVKGPWETASVERDHYEPSVSSEDATQRPIMNAEAVKLDDRPEEDPDSGAAEGPNVGEPGGAIRIGGSGDGDALPDVPQQP